MRCTCGGQVQHSDACPVYVETQRMLDDRHTVAADFEDMLSNFHRTEIPKSQAEISEIAKRRYCREALRRTDSARE